MIGLIGKKTGMTQIFDKEGRQRAVTLIQVGPCFVTDIKNADRDGYSAVQIGFGEAKEKHLTKAVSGKFKKQGISPVRIVKEIRTDEVEGLKVGSELRADNFEEGDYVDIVGVSKGRGYQGVVRRHNFKGGEASHGAKFGRESGSIAQGSAYPSRVPKGRKMAGQMGNKSLTVQNIEVIKVDLENNFIAVKGAVPGFNTGIVVVKNALKEDPKRAWKVAGGAEEVKEEEAPAETEAEVKEEAVAEEPEVKEEKKEEKAADSSPQEEASKDAPEKKEEPKSQDNKE